MGTACSWQKFYIHYARPLSLSALTLPPFWVHSNIQSSCTRESLDTLRGSSSNSVASFWRQQQTAEKSFQNKPKSQFDVVVEKGEGWREGKGATVATNRKGNPNPHKLQHNKKIKHTNSGKFCRCFHCCHFVASFAGKLQTFLATTTTSATSATTSVSNVTTVQQSVSQWGLIDWFEIDLTGRGNIELEMLAMT